MSDIPLNLFIDHVKMLKIIQKKILDIIDVEHEIVALSLLEKDLFSFIAENDIQSHFPIYEGLLRLISDISILILTLRHVSPVFIMLLFDSLDFCNIQNRLFL